MAAYEEEQGLPDLPIFRSIEPGLADIVRVSYRDRSWPKSADAGEALWKELFDDRYPDEVREGDEDKEPMPGTTPTTPRKRKRSAKKDS